MYLWHMLLFLISSLICAHEKPIMKEHLADQGEFLLCTYSGNTGVDCGIFLLGDNSAKLVSSTHIKNEDIKNFTTTVGFILSWAKSSYDITIKYACFAGPGTPSAQKDYLSHWRLPYIIDAKAIMAEYQLNKAIIVNDFVAMSYGINFLDTSTITTLYDTPAQVHGRRAIIGAGSGLGSVSMIWDDQQKNYISLPAEAGTGNFPVFDQFEFDLMMAMKKARNTSTMHWAFFVSLPGIQYMYQIVRDMNYDNYSTTEKSNFEAMSILNSAHTDPCCKKVADLFYTFYARFVYNFVWNILPFGGIYLVGETATTHPEMLSNIFLPEYFNCVESKRPTLQRIPIYIINDNDITARLYGAAQCFLLEKKELLKSEKNIS